MSSKNKKQNNNKNDSVVQSVDEESLNSQDTTVPQSQVEQTIEPDKSIQNTDILVDADTVVLESTTAKTKTNKFFRSVRVPFVFLLCMVVLCGIIYTVVITGISQALFPYQSNGSIITVTFPDGTQKSYGSEHIAQEFTEQWYLIGRPYGGPSNSNPSSQEQQEFVQERIKWWREFDPDNKADIPIELVTMSGSGVDPHISPEGANFQIQRLMKGRANQNVVEETVLDEEGNPVLALDENGDPIPVLDVNGNPVLDEEGNPVYQVETVKKSNPKIRTEQEIRAIIKKYTKGRFLGFIGEPTVNVLLVNLALDGLL